MSPKSTSALVDAGYKVRVEKSADRIYSDKEFEEAGAELAPAGSWLNAPLGDIILGLKELPEDDTPFPHTYIHFQHCFKKQSGWVSSLARFYKGHGTLYDLEFLTNPDGRRLAAFGYWAGYAGAGIAMMSWAHQITNPGQPQGPVPSFDSAPALTSHVKAALEGPMNAEGRPPRVIVIGALGRCGKGAVDFCLEAGIPEKAILKWDMAETSRGGPFPEITESDIFINCVYLGPNKTPPFCTLESLSTPERRLRVICDVSCDPNSENNPIPVYSSYSSFDNPTIPISGEIEGPELRVVAIDHLPTLVARESSDEFSSQLLPALVTLDSRDSDGVWQRANQVYADRIDDLRKELAN